MAVLSAVRGGKLKDPERLPGFVRGTARNLINNHLRVHNHRPHPSVAENASILPDPEERAYLGERMQLISTGLAELSPQDRLILLLTLVDGLQPREIADRLTRELSPQEVVLSLDGMTSQQPRPRPLLL